jgi:hypothetical protein
MPRHSAVARLQQAATLVLLVLALGWLVVRWPHSPALAIAGAVAIALAHSFLLALQFTLMVRASRDDPAPRPTAGQLLAAWWAEIWQDVWVFGWRQPYRWHALPDALPGAPGRAGIVFIHGFVCNRGFWNPWLLEAGKRGHAVVAVNLEPVFGSIDDYAGIIDEAVERVTQATGRPPLLVCHSMGGLAARAWLRTRQACDRVAHVITIGSPHRGTWLARFSHLPNGMQMRLDGQWVTELAAAPVPRPGLFTCWYSNCDNVVFPPATATLPGADNRFEPGAAHVELAFRARVMQSSLALAATL